MKTIKQGRGVVAVLITALIISGIFASPHFAMADGDKGKDGKIPIIVQKPIISDDGSDPKQPAPAPKKKSEAGS